MKIRFHHCLSLFALLTAMTIAAQEKGNEWHELLKITEAYRHMPGLSFQITYSYTEKQEAKIPDEQMVGTCRLRDSNYDTWLDSVEYLQGANYAVTIFYSDSLVQVSDKRDFQTLNLPLSDSLFRVTNTEGITSEKLNDSLNRITVYFKKHTGYSRFVIEYNPLTYLVANTASWFTVSGVEEDGERRDRDADDRDRKGGVLRIRFTNYSVGGLPENLFDENRVVTMQNGVLTLSPAFAGFRLINNATH